jgi:hypothetical protein
VALWDLLGLEAVWSAALRRWGGSLAYMVMFLVLFQLGPFWVGRTVWKGVMWMEGVTKGGRKGGEAVVSSLVSRLGGMMRDGAPPPPPPPPPPPHEGWGPRPPAPPLHEPHRPPSCLPTARAPLRLPLRLCEEILSDPAPGRR